MTQTIASLLRARADDDRIGLIFEDDTFTWREMVAESAARAAFLLAERREGPFHVGVLLENVPEYVAWLGAAAFAGATIVGINPTRRGSELAADIAHADCQFVVTDKVGAATLADLEVNDTDLGLTA